MEELISAYRQDEDKFWATLHFHEVKSAFRKLRQKVQGSYDVDGREIVSFILISRLTFLENIVKNLLLCINVSPRPQ